MHNFIYKYFKKYKFFLSYFFICIIIIYDKWYNILKIIWWRQIRKLNIFYKFNYYS